MCTVTQGLSRELCVDIFRVRKDQLEERSTPYTGGGR